MLSNLFRSRGAGAPFAGEKASAERKPEDSAGLHRGRKAKGREEGGKRRRAGHSAAFGQMSDRTGERTRARGESPRFTGRCVSSVWPAPLLSPARLLTPNARRPQARLGVGGGGGAVGHGAASNVGNASNARQLGAGAALGRAAQRDEGERPAGPAGAVLLSGEEGERGQSPTSAHSTHRDPRHRPLPCTAGADVDRRGVQVTRHGVLWDRDLASDLRKLRSGDRFEIGLDGSSAALACFLFPFPSERGSLSRVRTNSSLGAQGRLRRDDAGVPAQHERAAASEGAPARNAPGTLSCAARLWRRQAIAWCSHRSQATSNKSRRAR